MTITVRYARREELARVNEMREMVNALHSQGRPDIFRGEFCGELREQVFRQYEAENADVIVALAGDTVCGFAIAQYIDKPESQYMCARRFYHIEEFGVDAQYRRKGVATALINFCREEAERMRFPRIELDVWSFNEGAEQFYESVGFKTYRRYMEMNV